ncbi:helix-turn-helix transcriptional regulator [Thermopolyspora sp. NPDC052614]|uniref:helix-turn-helix domain-containing protein n=1 Tax=Thermopolyspora sp. NPDC052614 TaxID=3155682 RepID=UPI003444214D
MSSTVRLRHLSEELVRLRRTAGLTVEEVTTRLNKSMGWLTYMEGNKWVKANIKNITALLDLYGIHGQQREEILELAQAARQKDWWLAYRDLFPAKLPGFEAAATTIRTFEALLVPGLLQTKDYAAAVARGRRVFTPPVIARQVEARLTRQKILDRENPPELWALIDEAALLRSVGGPGVMRQQLEHLMNMAARPSITIQVVPLRAGAHAAMTGGFMILEFGNDQDAPLVYMEGVTRSQFMEKPEDVNSYTLTFEHVATSALPPDESAARLSELQNHHPPR